MAKIQVVAFNRPILVRRALIGALVFGVLYVFLLRRRFKVESTDPGRFGNEAVLLPVEYHQPSDQSSYCQSHFGTPFLESLSKRAAEYCTPESTGRLTCFNSATVPDHSRIDVMCLGQNTIFDPQKNKFLLDCTPRELSEVEVEMGARPLNQFPAYWYSTGPKNIMQNYVELGDASMQTPKSSEPKQTYILIKRDAARDNMWHSLMEIMAAQMSLDVLHITTDPLTKMPYFRTQDVANAQVIILDDLADGHFFDLWTLFARKPPIRLSQMEALTKSLLEGDIVIPLPGGANQLWQGDWEDLGCTDSSLLKGFSSRILNLYHISDPVKSPNDHLILTFVDRTTTRRLVDQNSSLALLRQKYPQIQVDVVDYSLMSFADQLAITRKTDILVGAHGAGLTHGMFLQSHSALVEIMPVNFHHKGFRNMANMLGHNYFMQESEDNKEKTGATGDWQSDDVYLKPADFVALVGKAVESKMKNVFG